MKKSILIILLFLSGCALVFAQDKDTITTESGLKYIVLEKGSGDHAVNNKAVEVNYTGYLTDGKIFDSSFKRNEPIEFVLGQAQVIKGWDEGIALMNVGDKYRLIIPPDLAYGDKGAGDAIPPNSTLIFDVELLSVSEPKTPITDALVDEIINGGIDAVIKKYYELKKTHPNDYNFKESELNTFGYQLLQNGNTDEAIKIFTVNAEAYPNSFNVYDSLGEAYMAKGDKENAIINYKKSLELNPDNENSKDMLQQLQK